MAETTVLDCGCAYMGDEHSSRAYCVEHYESSEGRSVLRMWECPTCGFSFDAVHTDPDGKGYTCPICSPDPLRKETP